MPQHIFRTQSDFEKCFGSSQSIAGVRAHLTQYTTMSTAVNNSRSRITTLPLRAVERASNHKRKLVRVHHIRTVNRLLAGCAAGFLPVASYILAHIESRSEPWLWALVLAALAYSAPTLASWAASWTHKGKAKTALFKAWGFTVLLEGTMVLSHLPALSLSGLIILVAINSAQAFNRAR